MAERKKIPVWLDCDPGNDDVFAILLCTYDPAIELIGISSVAGNVSLDNTTHNALAVLEMLGNKQEDYKVYRGSTKPLVKEKEYAAYVHGTVGIGGIEIPRDIGLHETVEPGYLEAMKQAVLENQNNICFVCTGPLTNIAKLFEKYPELKSMTRFITAMGGAVNMGNVSPYAEFNFGFDPHAASRVVGDKELQGKIALAPLNLTHKAIANTDVLKRVRGVDHSTDVREKLYKILTFYAESYGKRGFKTGPPIHDPVAVYLLLIFNDFLEDSKLEYLRRKIIVTEDGEKEGQSVIVNNNYDNSTEEEGGTYLGLNIDTEKFWSRVLDAITNSDRRINRS